MHAYCCTVSTQQYCYVYILRFFVFRAFMARNITPVCTLSYISNGYYIIVQGVASFTLFVFLVLPATMHSSILVGYSTCSRNSGAFHGYSSSSTLYPRGWIPAAGLPGVRGAPEYVRMPFLKEQHLRSLIMWRRLPRTLPYETPYVIMPGIGHPCQEHATTSSVRSYRQQRRGQGTSEACYRVEGEYFMSKLLQCDG